VSGATYRIDVKHKPEIPAPNFAAVIVRLSDDTALSVHWGDTPAEAERLARLIIAHLGEAQEPFSLYVDDDGQDAEAPHSVKV
jgi:hypothetical protein